MSSKAFGGGYNQKLAQLLKEKLEAQLAEIEQLQQKDLEIDEKIEEVKEDAEDTKVSIQSTSSTALQYPISENVSSQIGHTDNRFTTAHSFYTQSVCVYYNGIKQIKGVHWEVTGLNSFKLYFSPNPLGYIETTYVPSTEGYNFSNNVVPIIGLQ